ncbi:chitin synthase [Pyronema omphalodes]|nr:chitin synthase [Pyronema omphalodes]
MSGRYHGIGGNNDRDELHIPMPDASYTPVSDSDETLYDSSVPTYQRTQSYYSTSSHDDHQYGNPSQQRRTSSFGNPTHQRTGSFENSPQQQQRRTSYHGPPDQDYSTPDYRRSSTHLPYADQVYSMPEWLDDDAYARQTTPVSAGSVYAAPTAPPPPPNPYVGNNNDIPGFSNYPPTQNRRYSSYPMDAEEDRQPMLASPGAMGGGSMSSRHNSMPNMQSGHPQSFGPNEASEGGEKKITNAWGGMGNEVTLKEGNLVLNCPTPEPLLKALPLQEATEFKCMRYSAATCDPSEFVKKRFALRPQLFGHPRATELFIVITMYSEDEILFANTMMGVIQNIEYMCSDKVNNDVEFKWGPNGWKNIVVCVVSDGVEKIHPKTRSLLAAMGCYQHDISKQMVNGEKVQAHIYEYTTQVGLKREGDKIIPVIGGLKVPIQMIFCLKEDNKQKINSHRWFFQAFGPSLNPNICVLIDAGTKPGKDSIYELWRAFYLNKQCAGACGEIKAELTNGNWWKNPLVATQNFEYKMSNILDKPLESVFGFISVLPGAFSAYRYSALQNDANGEGPLDMYFKGEGMHSGVIKADILEKNMYLAEDRILCFELVTKRKSAWTLQYVKSAHATTDVPEEVAELVKQRRRWLNGSFFAAIFALVKMKNIWRSGHSPMRKMVFVFEFFYQTVSLLFSWFALANFFLVFRILTASLGEDEMHFRPGRWLSVIFEWIYFAVLFTCFILALGNKPDGSRIFFKAMMYFWAIIMIYLMFAAIFITTKSIQKELRESDGFTAGDIFANSIFRDLVVSLSSTYILYFVASFMYLEPWHMFTSFLQYLLLSPSYINVLNIYAFCNVHDISWGTKEGGKTSGPGKHQQVERGLVADGSSLQQSQKNRIDNYQLELERLSGAGEVKKEKSEEDIAKEESEKEKFFYADVRCIVVLGWCSTNFGLAAVILNSGGLNRLVNADPAKVQNTRSTIYMAVVLWSVAALALVRFIGACWFLVLRMFRGV